jgi:hypothetical protein
MFTIRNFSYEIAALLPGQCYNFTYSLLELVACRENVIDEIMENVVGSSYDIIVNDNPITRTVTFKRLERSLTHAQTYVSPDRRHLFTYDGMYYHRNK